jgi:hypothetical protein
MIIYCVYIIINDGWSIGHHLQVTGNFGPYVMTFINVLCCYNCSHGVVIVFW